MTNALEGPVKAFITELAPQLERISESVGLDSKRAEDDVTTEAFNIATAVMAADDRQTDDELWAILACFGPRFDTKLGYATPDDLRKANIISGKRAWLNGSSQLFGVLLADDKRSGGGVSWRYYELAMAIAHAVSAIDGMSSRDELEAIEAFRMQLIRGIELEGLAHGGRKKDRMVPVKPAPGAPEAVDPPEPIGPVRPLEELLAELDALVGLQPVKEEIRLVANLIQVENLRKDRKLATAETSKHLVFTGNPGTGKTTVARLLAQIYRTLGVSERGQLVETDRSGLVAGYVGQTAIQVRTVVESAIGGVLLIDEAYALARGDESKDFGQEAIDTLVKMMEDHRDEVVVVACGYPEEMIDFIESNPGLRSRFPKTIHFPDYSTDELIKIFEGMCTKAAYTPTPEFTKRLRELLEAEPRDKGFGNARHSRNMFEAAVGRQANRIVAIKDPTNEQIMTLLPEDLG